MQGHQILALAMAVCAFAFVVSFFAALYAMLLVFSRTGMLNDSVEDRRLSWGERAARRMNRFSMFLTADEFGSLRRLLHGAWAGAIGSFGLLFLLAVLSRRS